MSSDKKKTNQHGHSVERNNTVHVDTCDFDPRQKLVLELLRFFCLSYATPMTQGWLSAFKRASDVLGPVEGPMLAHSVSELLSAIRRERTTPFNFVDPRCSECAVRIYPSEHAVLKLIRAAHEDSGEPVITATQEIVEGDVFLDTVNAGKAVGSCLRCIDVNIQANVQVEDIQPRILH